MPTRPYEFPIGGNILAFEKGDITKIAADAIGNAANGGLRGGGGVDGAIHRAGGPEIMRELNQIRAEIGNCPTGQAVATGAGELKARWVLHAVGPVYRGGKSGEAEALASCYRECMALANERGATTLALPAISAGVFGYPLGEAAEIAVRTISGSLSEGSKSVSRVTFVLFDDAAFEAFCAAADGLGLAQRRSGPKRQ